VEDHGIASGWSEHSSEFVSDSLKPREILKARLALNRADIVLPVSNYLNDAIKRCRMGRRFWIIPNAVNTDLFHPRANGEDAGKKRIIFVGILKPLKGIDVLLSAVSILAAKRLDFVLDIVGDGPGREEYERMAVRLGLEELVCFHGLRNKKKVARMMGMSSFLVHPSLIETFGVTSIEALACGIPVIATDLPVFREKINADRGILAPPGDAVALAGAIDKMLDQYRSYDPEELAGYVRRNYSYKIVGGQLDEMYHDVLQTIYN